MNRRELIDLLSEETMLSKKDIDRVLSAFSRKVVRVLQKGDKLQLSGFGTFERRRRPQRKGINPTNKEPITLPETYVPKFTPGKNLKEMVKPQ